MDGIIDISIARTPLRLDDVDYKILSSEPMIAVSSKDMLPEKNGSLKLSDLLNIPLIIYRRYEALIMDAFHSRGMEPDLFCVCDDPRGAMLWAKEGLATAIFPQSMSSLCQGLRIQPLAESDLETQIAVIWKKGRKLNFPVSRKIICQVYTLCTKVVRLWAPDLLFMLVMKKTLQLLGKAIFMVLQWTRRYVKTPIVLLG